MNTTTVTGIDPEIKLEAQKTARSLGMSLSGLINKLLKDFVKTKGTKYSEENPTQYMIDGLKKSEEDIKAGRVISFETIHDAIDYVSSLIEGDDKKLTGHPN